MISLAFAIVLALQEPPPPLPPRDAPSDDVPKDEIAELMKELKAEWMKVIELCKAEKKDEVQKAIAAMEMTREDMIAIFGPEHAARVHGDYRSTWEKAVMVEAADDLIKRTKKNAWDDVDVWCLNNADDKDLSSDDRGVVFSLVHRNETRVFNIRLKVKDRPSGLVLKCFVKTTNGWKMGLRIGKPLAEK